MKIKTVKLYTYDELSDEAKEKAREWWASLDGAYVLEQEAMDTMKAFVSAFNVCLTDWEIDFSDVNRCQWKIKGNEDVLNLKGARAYKWMVNNLPENFTKGDCPLTGMCFDENCIDAVREFYKHPGANTTIEDVINDGLHRLFKAVESDYEWFVYGAGAEETIRDNEYTFTEEGKRED